MKDSNLEVVVVGAGIVGASVAYHAARSGASVTLVEAGRPGAGVTADSFAWIGASGASLGPAAALRATSTIEYRRLAAELPGLPVTWSGSLSWGTEDAPPVPGPGQVVVDAETVARLEPNLRRPPDWAVWAPDDGAVDATGVTERMIEGARAHGAAVRSHRVVTGLVRERSGRVVGAESAAGLITGDVVVVAAAAATASLCAPLGVRVPVQASPATLFRLRAPADLVRRVVHNDDFDLRQVAADTLIAAADSQERTLSAIRSSFRGASGVEIVGARSGARPMPADGQPIIGPVTDVPGLYLVTLHAGVTLAPAVGRVVANELVHDHSDLTLTDLRLDRFER